MAIFITRVMQTVVYGAVTYVICATMKQKNVGYLVVVYAVFMLLLISLDGLSAFVEMIQGFIESLRPSWWPWKGEVTVERP